MATIEMDKMGKWDVVRTEGDTRHWEIVERGQSDFAAAELVSRVEQALVKGQWTKVASAGKSAASHSSDWRFTGTDGKPWKATLRIESVGEGGHEFTAALAVARAS